MFFKTPHPDCYSAYNAGSGINLSESETQHFQGRIRIRSDLESMIRIQTDSFRIDNTEGLSIRTRVPLLKLPDFLRNFLNLVFSQSLLSSDTGTFEIPNKEKLKRRRFFTLLRIPIGPMRIRIQHFRPMWIRIQDPDQGFDVQATGYFKTLNSSGSGAQNIKFFTVFCFCLPGSGPHNTWIKDD